MGYYTGKIMGVQAGISPEIDAYINGLTTPLSDAQVSKLDTFVTSVKTGFGISALSDVFDIMYILGGETEESSLRNLVKRMHDGIIIGYTTFTPFEGVKGAGGKINTNYEISTQSVNLSQNNSSMGFYSRTGGGGGNTIEMGADESNPYIIFQAAFNGTKCYVEMSNNIGTGIANTSRLGFFSASRLNSNNYIVYKNGSQLGVENILSGTIVDSNLYLLGANTGFSSDIQMAFAFAGRGLTGNETLTLTNAIEAYMDSNGKGVI